jgi:hypothetical protein
VLGIADRAAIARLGRRPAAAMLMFARVGTGVIEPPPVVMFNLLWLAGTASREPTGPTGWRRIIDRAVNSAWPGPRPASTTGAAP